MPSDGCTFYALHGKRLVDTLGAGLMLFLLLPFMVVIGVCILESMGLPILFVQKRPGFRGRLFRIYKFRTMTNRRNKDGRLLPDADRITPIGKRLREYSLDEIPEIINVLKGDMSFVGPRPLLRRYLARYTPKQNRRHAVKPGITGWAQVNGRNSISWEEKFKYDLWYIDHVSLSLDMKILKKTLFKVLRREAISGDGEATMQEFTGGM